MIRDRIGFSSAAGHKPRSSQLFSATQRPKSEYNLLKEVGGSEASSDTWSALIVIEQQSRSHIVEAGNLDERGWLGNLDFNKTSVAAEVA